MMSEKMILWGAGVLGANAYAYYRNLGKADNIIAFADADKHKVGSLLYGIPIISIEQMLILVNQSTSVVITHENYRVAQGILMREGIKYSIFDYQKKCGLETLRGDKKIFKGE